MATPEELMKEVLREKADYDDWDRDFTPNPYDPWRKTQALADLGSSAVPFLASALERAEEARWASFALQLMGPIAGPAAADALVRYIDRGGEAVVSLWWVDEARARSLDFHRRAPSRGAIADALRHDPAKLVAFVRDLLLDDDPDVLTFALGSGKYGDESRINDVIERRPDLVPTDLVRVLLVHSDAGVRDRAVAMITHVHAPEDAEAVLFLVVKGKMAVPRNIDWLAPLPGSECLLPLIEGTEAIFELVRRRNAAGLATPPELARDRLRAALCAPAAKGGRNDTDHTRTWQIHFAARAAVELRDPELAEPLVLSIGPPEGAGRFEGTPDIADITLALSLLGDVGLAVARAGAERATGDRAQRLGWVIAALARSKEVLMEDHLARADAMFESGRLEASNVVASAYASYAKELLARPRSARAAYQLAWIDRGFGVPMTNHRLDWLRDLGVPPSFLDELSTRPRATLSGFRFTHHEPTGYDEDLLYSAERAMNAGFPGNAAYIYRRAKREEDAARSVAASKARIESLRAAMPK